MEIKKQNIILLPVSITIGIRTFVISVINGFWKGFDSGYFFGSDSQNTHKSLQYLFFYKADYISISLCIILTLITVFIYKRQNE